MQSIQVCLKSYTFTCTCVCVFVLLHVTITPTSKYILQLTLTYYHTSYYHSIILSYSAINTNGDLRNFITCSFFMCGGDTVRASNCPSTTDPRPRCQGDTFYRLFNAAGQQVAYNDDGCASILTAAGPVRSLCSSIRYTPPVLAACQVCHILYI